MEVLTEQVAEICALIKADAVVDILIVVFLFMIFVCLAWIRDGIDHIHNCIKGMNANNINDIKLIHKNHNKNITPPVEHPPVQRGTENDCNHEWGVIESFKDENGDVIKYLLYCPKCKQEQCVDIRKWRKMQLEREYMSKTNIEEWMDGDW